MSLGFLRRRFLTTTRARHPRIEASGEILLLRARRLYVLVLISHFVARVVGVAWLPIVPMHGAV